MYTAIRVIAEISEMNTSIFFKFLHIKLQEQIYVNQAHPQFIGCCLLIDLSNPNIFS